MGNKTKTDRLKFLEARKKMLFSTLSRTEQFILNLNTNESLTQIKSRLDVIKPLHSEFTSLIIELQSLSDTDFTNLDEEMDEFETRYFSLVTQLSEASNTSSLLSSSPTKSSLENISNPSSHSTQVRLPRITLATFNGDFKQWTNFKDNFCSLIHTNSSLQDVQRLHYLKASLRSPALDLIANLPITDSNYQVAWNLLLARYNNQRMISNSHVSTLLNIPKMKSDSLQSLKELTFNYFKNINALRALGEEVDKSTFLLLPLLTSKMEVNLLKRWEETLDRDSKPSLENIEYFLNKQIDILEISSTDKIKQSDSQVNSKTDNNKLSKFDSNKNRTSSYNTKNNSVYSYVETSSPYPMQPSGGWKNNFNKNCEPQVNNTIKHYPNKPHSSSSPRRSTIQGNEVKLPCHACKLPHRLYLCPTFNGMSPSQRLDLISKLNLCENCFNTSHQVASCLSKFSCKICGSRHNTLVHQNSSVVASSIISKSPSSVIKKVLLATALVEIVSPNSQKITVRALLDGGSQSNFICHSIVQRFHLPTVKCNVPIKGINQTKSLVSQKVSSIVKSKICDFNLPMQFLVIPKITDNLPQEPIDVSKWNIPPNIQLADPEFYSSNQIDILIGAECFLEILSQGQLKLNDSLPTLQFTKFGWIVGGKYPMNMPNSTDLIKETESFLSIDNSDQDLNSLIPKFWELEECRPRKLMSQADKAVEDFYSNTVQRDSSGRYSVRLPFCKDPGSLGSSSDTALKCLKALERRFLNNPRLKKQYQDFMAEYLLLGHMKALSEKELTSILEQPHYFLPHHAVIREQSLTTKLRVVFNASMPTSSGTSLNDLLAPGPSLQTDTFVTLLRFRSHKFGLISDVEKMFRQILLQHPDYFYQLIYWRDEPHLPVKVYVLLTVTYGTVPAPYLAIKTLHQLAYDESTNFPKASEILIRDFFVDDLISGCDSEEELKELQSQLNQLLNKGGMCLRKWCSNSPSFFLHQDNPSNDKNYILDLSKDSDIKTLGIYWQTSSDNFQYKINFNRDCSTKRTIVSNICKVFDPLGLLGPLIMSAKLLIRDLWMNNIGWDEGLPTPLLKKWLEFVDNTSSYNLFSIPRYYSSIDSPNYFELHGFSDASEQGYGACCYIKCRNEKGEVSVSLFCSKSRVAPTKTQSIPRLELCGALLLSELYLKVINSLSHISFQSVYLWSDSLIVLHWLAAEACKWKTFVGNRVSQIQDNTKNCFWMHVSTNSNPADLLSRGSLILPDLWWNGPEWLASSSEYEHPNLNYNLEVPDRKPDSLVHVSTVDISYSNVINIKHFSSWSRLYRVLAYLFRFSSNCCKPKNQRNLGELTVEEIDNSQQFLIKSVQLEMFSEELKILISLKPLLSKSKILSLNPFLDSKEILRVGGRIKNAPIPFDQKHPILICSKHPIASLIVNHYHKITLHTGPQHLLYSIRQRFWLINGKRLCKKIVRECTTCFRSNPKPFTYLMGDLPAHRLKVSKPFTYSGVDFCGPLLIRQSSRRNAPLVKAYACLFICLSTKAVHIEPVSDLTSQAFIACLRRFIARRGICKTLLCDNGRNFVGAESTLNDLKTFYSKGSINTIESKFSDIGIKFSWIPARSPTFGGLWERAIKSCKHHLRRVMGTCHLTFEELCTLLAQVEAQLNSRPITPLSDNPSDLSALCPSHFLVGEVLTAVPDANLEHEPNLVNRWQRVQQAQQHFWRRWSAEYLGQLQHRSKWRSSKTPPPIGQLVLLKDENTSPLKWPLARITSLHHGKDGVPRVASVWTTHGETRRALTKLCPLPLGSTTEPQEDVLH